MKVRGKEYTLDRLAELVPEFIESIDKFRTGKKNDRVYMLTQAVAGLRDTFGIDVLYQKGDGVYSMVNPVLVLERLIPFGSDGYEARPIVEAIRELHIERDDILNEMRRLKASSRVKLRKLAQRIEAIEYELQSFWSFPLDASRHEWYKVPHCKCEQVIDPSLARYWKVSQTCPLHGGGRYVVGTGWVQEEKK